MCDTCGCNITEGNRHLIEEGGKHAHASAVEVLSNLLHENNHAAAHNREHFDRHHVLTINLMSSPGSGKTALLEATIEQLGKKYRIGVIEGDLETENDAARIRAKGVPAVQIMTGTACHLDAHLVHTALHDMNLDEIDILFIENVGNLVCPASFDLGQHYNVTLLSTTEGDDKPAKYPVMFRAADAMIITKSDLLEVLGDFDPQKATQYLRNLASPADVMTLSARSGEHIDLWIEWLHGHFEQQQQRIAEGATRKPAIQPDGIALHADL
ncbi:MAG TPA: hydrogenase accessory protein HypB [Gammaproteobacteria bacterium]|nr:hydrogenase accessory protein HypB [Gammaproteobacteria bacterium]